MAAERGLAFRTKSSVHLVLFHSQPLSYVGVRALLAQALCPVSCTAPT